MGIVHQAVEGCRRREWDRRFARASATGNKDDDWVWRSPFVAGEMPYLPNAVRDYIVPAAKQASCGSIGWHCFRHNYCSRLDSQANGMKIAVSCRKYGGETGIRTLDTVSRIHAFQACAFSHSAISPRGKRCAGAPPAAALNHCNVLRTMFRDRSYWESFKSALLPDQLVSGRPRRMYTNDGRRQGTSTAPRLTERATPRIPALQPKGAARRTTGRCQSLQIGQRRQGASLAVISIIRSGLYSSFFNCCAR